jgi:putative oxidoreductase
MNLNLTFPALLDLRDLSLFVLRLVVAIVFGASGYFHLKDPVGRAKSIELSPAATRGLGAAESLASIGLVTGILIQPAALGLILVGLGAIQKKAFKWKTGFWGEKASGWHYDLMLLAMNLVVLATAGGGWVLVPVIAVK